MNWPEDRRKFYKQSRSEVRERFPSSPRDKRILFVARFRGIDFDPDPWKNPLVDFDDDADPSTGDMEVNMGGLDLDADEGNGSDDCVASSFDEDRDDSYQASSSSDFHSLSTSQPTKWDTQSALGDMADWDDPNPHTMTCPYCKKYTMIKKDNSLKCINCDLESPLKKGITIKLIKEKIISSMAAHQMNCSHQFTSYAFCKAAIALGCDHCGRAYRVLDE